MTQQEWHRLERRTRRLPGNPNLEQLKNQAKDILKAHKLGDESCCNVLGFLPKFENKPDPEILSSKVTLQEVQHGLAMSYDWADWPMMVQTVLASNDLPVNGNQDPVLQFVNKMLIDALKSGASDIYFEPYEFQYRVRFKIDGVMKTVATPPVELGPKFTEKLKSRASMDITEYAAPASGRITFPISKTKTVYFKIDVFPMTFGEKIDLRILDSSAIELFDQFGFNHEQKQSFRNAVKQPHGLILITGPRESGRTVTLYSAVNELNTPAVKIVSIEQPVEVYLEGVNQYSVGEDEALEEAILSCLKQRPDILVIGEIKTAEAAELAIDAAQTGHLVIATMYAESAADALTRLREMGISASTMLRAVNLVTHQQLVRRLCPQCKVEVEVNRQALLAAGFAEGHIEQGLQLFEAVGCDQCSEGYKGRIGVFELIEVTPELSQVLEENGTLNEVDAAYRQAGFKSSLHPALVNVEEGVTSLDEVQRIIS